MGNGMLNKPNPAYYIRFGRLSYSIRGCRNWVPETNYKQGAFNNQVRLGETL